MTTIKGMDQDPDSQPRHSVGPRLSDEGGKARAAEPVGIEIVERLNAARTGSSEALGDLFQSCRNYLLLIANLAINPGLKAKVGASDLVQETFCEAQRIFDRFEGETEEELLRWLSQILEYRIGTSLNRFYGTACRDLVRELSWCQMFGSAVVGDLMASSGISPSAVCRSKEEQEQYQQALLSLPPEQRMVIGLRVVEELPFDEVGLRMNRSAEAARKLFGRAVLRLQDLLGKQ